MIVTTPDTSVCELADTRLSAYVAAIRALPWDEIAAPPFNGSRADEDRDHPGLAAAGRKRGDRRPYRRPIAEAVIPVPVSARVSAPLPLTSTVPPAPGPSVPAFPRGSDRQPLIRQLANGGVRWPRPAVPPASAGRNRASSKPGAAAGRKIPTLACRRSTSRATISGSILGSRHRTPMPAASVAARPSAARRRPLRPPRMREICGALGRSPRPRRQGLIGAYHRRVAAVIERAVGFVAK